ncbi:MAG: glucohydrolase, partial [Tannerellaceae bacterium]|nr:glucohydrolase [Tannerellaceae bacterium]
MNKYKQGDTWWQQAIFYHIYPQSYYDSNGDGIGDLQGIRQKLSYLQDLGVDAIWLSPVFLSPLMDEGYDIADYTSIHPRYGTLDDFKQLLYEAHQMNIRLILDLVLNHTSDMHPWFMEARSSVDHPRRNWYLWHPGRKGRRPNNWMTNFGGSAWKKDEATGEYYHHSFFPEQPDLNWRNPEVKKAMFNIIRFWMTLGVDGFRLDVANLLFKHSDYPDNPIWALVADRNVYNRNQPETYELLRDFRALLNRFQGRIGIGEIYVSPPGNSCLAASFTGNGEDMLHMAFDFTLVFTRWSANAFYKVIRRYYKALPEKGWPCFVFSNHDLGRGVNHYLFPAGKEQKAK